jgi:hypothetical protein
MLHQMDQLKDELYDDRQVRKEGERLLRDLED